MHEQVEVRNTLTGATGFMPASAVQNFENWVLIDDPDPSGDGHQQGPPVPPEETEQAPASGRPRSKRSSRS